jgi:putative spermidine/putrescine transport system substrate-binding protein
MRHHCAAASFKHDVTDLVATDLKAGRREFLRWSLAAGALPMLAATFPQPARAQAREIVVANFGGQVTPAMQAAWGAPYTADTGVKVVFDGATPLPSKVKAMVESGKVVWDAVDADLFVGPQLGKQGLLERIDYGVVDRNMVRPEWATEYGIGNYTYSFVLAYDKTQFADKPPTWVDFFDTKKYPGKRALWKFQMGCAEGCLLADGVPADKLYPLDMPRAIEKAKSLGKDLLLWSAGAEVGQMFLDKEIAIGCIFHPRAAFLERETKGRVGWTWNQALYCPAAFVVPKGNPAGKEVMRFLGSILKPERQLKLLELFANGLVAHRPSVAARVGACTGAGTRAPGQHPAQP